MSLRIHDYSMDSGVVMHTYKPSAREAKAAGSLGLLEQLVYPIRK